STRGETSALKLANGWTARGKGFRKPSWNREKDLFIVSGTLQSPDGDRLNRSLATLPSSCRPTAHLIFATSSHYGLSRFDVFPDGDIRLVEVEKGKSA